MYSPYMTAPSYLALVCLAIVSLTTCTPTPTEHAAKDSAIIQNLPVIQLESRFMLSGWILPKNKEKSSPFSETLGTYILSNESQLELFLDSIQLIRLNGNFENLSNIDFNESILVAIYYMWRPIRGNPLTISQPYVSNGSVMISIELDDEITGKEFPFLYAPLEISAINRNGLPTSDSVQFIFTLNDGQSTVVSHTLN